jgi:hypothetical protein
MTTDKARLGPRIDEDEDGQAMWAGAAPDVPGTTCPVTRAGSNGRCNTIYCTNSTNASPDGPIRLARLVQNLARVVLWLF